MPRRSWNGTRRDGAFDTASFERRIGTMTTLQIDNLRCESRGEATELSAVLRLGPQSRKIFFRTAHTPVAGCGDPFVPAALLPAMRGKLEIDLRCAVSEEILLAAARVQALERAWHPRWGLVALNAEARRANPNRASTRAVAAFFTGGVDSFYTLHKHRNEITHLVFVSGFDVPLHRSALRQFITRELRRTAEEIELPLIEVETNLRELSDGAQFSWEDQHGAGLAAVAHFLAPSFDKVYIPSTYALPFLVPYGSHPGLDPMWSSNSLELVHDGIEATRFDKIGALSSWDAAVRNFRVCWQLVEGQYNCCRCRKCLWTMALLRAHGLLERAATFPMPLDLHRLSEQGADVTEQTYRLIQALAKIEKRGDDPALAGALRSALDRKESFLASVRRSARRQRRFVSERTKTVLRRYRNRARSLFHAPRDED
jgi:hypothetical protein